MVICLGQGADLHIAQLMTLPLTIFCSSKSRLVLPEWFCISGAGLDTQVVLEKRPLNECNSSVVVKQLRYYLVLYRLEHGIIMLLNRNS